MQNTQKQESKKSSRKVLEDIDSGSCKSEDNGLMNNNDEQHPTMTEVDDSKQYRIVHLPQSETIKANTMRICRQK